MPRATNLSETTDLHIFEKNFLVGIPNKKIVQMVLLLEYEAGFESQAEPKILSSNENNNDLLKSLLTNDIQKEGSKKKLISYES